MHERETARLAAQFEHPVERRVAATEDDQLLIVEGLRALDAVVNALALEGFGAFDTEAARLKGADAACNHDRTRVKAGPRRSAQEEPPIGLPAHLGDFLAEMERRMERLDLLHQPIHQLLRTTHQQGRDVVNWLVGIQLCALPARVRERIDHVRRNAKQPQLEDLEQAARAGADDDDVALDRSCVRDFHARLA